ncbi:Protein vip1 [Coemansia sp. RSA 552]|nr:Protein vip1 [Coemansia sp. RSA 552]
MVTANWNSQLPSAPDATYVVAERIPLSATESTVREFFEFCGPIEQLTLEKVESGHQRALVKFSTAEAAKTALLLGDAQINYETIEVKPLFPATHPEAQHSESEHQPATGTRAPITTSPADANYEGKPALYVAHELLAAGYMLGERVLDRASQFDAKYRVKDRTQTQARSLDNDYKCSDYLQQWDDKFKVSNRAKSAYDKLQSNSLGKKVMFTVSEAYQSALQLSRDAASIAERKRQNDEKLFGKFSLPRSSSRSSASGSASGPGFSQAGPAGGDYASSAVPPTQQPADEKQQQQQQQPPPGK